VGVGKAIVAGAVAEALHRRVNSAGGGHGREAEGALDQGPRGISRAGDEAGGGVGRVEVEGADEVGGVGAGGSRGQLTRRGGGQAQEEVVRRGGGSDGGSGDEEGKAEERRSHGRESGATSGAERSGGVGKELNKATCSTSHNGLQNRRSYRIWFY
jgi:hypothetical protein